MFGAERLGKEKLSLYATKADFCQIFEKDMNRLYRLSFLLTGDEAVAERCFLAGLHMAQEGNPVFKEWAEGWARRAIILSAIREIRPRVKGNPSELLGPVADDHPFEPAEIAGIVTLPVFERFAFVMSVLEGYSDHECSLHLGCTRTEVTAARVCAFDRIGSAAEHGDNLSSIASAHEQHGTGTGFQAQAIACARVQHCA